MPPISRYPPTDGQGETDLVMHVEGARVGASYHKIRRHV